MKKIEGFEYYYITENGNVISKFAGKEKFMSQITKPEGYCYVTLCLGKNRINKYVHRLVAEAFIPNPDNKPQINHKNGNKLDNRIENLERCTSSENHKHAFDRLGRQPNRGCLGILGKNHWSSKPVAQYSLNNIFITNYDNGRIARESTGINHIAQAARGTYKQAGGFIWKYI